jgi:apolipoprotein D and lipocalin family protein
MRSTCVLMALLVMAVAAVAQETRPLTLVEHVDLSRYAGTWYEIARLPNEFQEKCTGDVTATYTPREDGEIEVVNRCRTTDGKVDEAQGVARPVNDEQGNAALEVRFAPAILSFLPNVWGDYRIIGLDHAYRWAVVGEPKREHLWILERAAEAYNRALAVAKANGFDVSNLEKTPHRKW